MTKEDNLEFSTSTSEIKNNFYINLDGMDDWYLVIDKVEYKLDKKKLYEFFKGFVKT